MVNGKFKFPRCSYCRYIPKHYITSQNGHRVDIMGFTIIQFLVVRMNTNLLIAE